MASDNETAQQFCDKVGHDYQPVMGSGGFEGIECANCGKHISAKELNGGSKR